MRICEAASFTQIRIYRVHIEDRDILMGLEIFCVIYRREENVTQTKQNTQTPSFRREDFRKLHHSQTASRLLARTYSKIYCSGSVLRRYHKSIDVIQGMEQRKE